MPSMLYTIKRKLRGSRRVYLLLGALTGLPWNIPMALARLLRGTDGNLVVFSAFEYRNYGDSPRYISERLRELRPDIDIVWLFKDPEAARAHFPLPDSVRALPWGPLHPSGAWAMARARVVVDNYNKKFYLRFPGKDQVYIQTWHGDRPFKKIGFDNAGQHVRMLEERCSLILSGSEYGERVLRSAFHYQGEILRQGLPRNDLLVRGDPALAEAVRKRLGASKDEGLLLYAPTFRDSQMRAHQQQRVPLDLRRALDRLERRSGRRWRCLVRAHYMSLGISLDEADERLIPASDYPEMAELLLVSDALLTDYSSCASDFALLGRPVFLYQDDPEGYRSRDRELYVDMKDTPYWVASNPDELDALIAAATPERARENCEAILRYHGVTETGRATDAVVEYILARLDALNQNGR